MTDNSDHSECKENNTRGMDTLLGKVTPFYSIEMFLPPFYGQ